MALALRSRPASDIAARRAACPRQRVALPLCATVNGSAVPLPQKEGTSTAPERLSDEALLHRASANWVAGKSTLSPEERAALRRRIRGSAKAYFKECVAENVVDAQPPTTQRATVPFLPFLLGIVAAMLLSTLLVVQHTAGM